MKLLKLNQVNNDQGFTIVETLIATIVFGLVLLVLTAGVIQITRTYYKGITENNTQNTARNLLNDISQAIEFGGGDVSYTSYYSSPTPDNSYNFCIGNQRYSYQLGYEVKGTPNAALYQTYHALVVDNVLGCRQSSGGSSALNLNSTLSGTSSRDLIGQDMRLVKLTVIPYSASTDQINEYQNEVYQIDVRIVYGDSDLLCAPTLDPASCNTNAIINNPNYLLDPDLTCKGTSGTQFCAVSELSTVVARRLQ